MHRSSANWHICGERSAASPSILRMTWRVGILWFGGSVATILGSGCALSAQQASDVTLRPGQDIEAIVENAPEGTRFHFEPGIYRQQTIYPKDRQELIGQDGVILSGAMELTSWEKRNGFWRTQDDLPEPLPSEEACASGRDLCHLREDLFVDGRLYERVGSLDELAPGAWHYKDSRAYLADHPTRQSVELGVTPLAIGGDASDVVVKDLIIEKYASLAQNGAIDFRDGRGWQVTNVTARWNHGVGLAFGPQARVEGGSFSHNGQLGMKGTGEGSTVEGVEIAYNNYAGYSTRWEAGGTKFYRTSGLVVRNACVHHNEGPGLWTDIDNIDVLYEGNTVFSNANDGIKHEISYDATIRDNVVAHNGKGHDVWLWGSQILIQNSRNVEVESNLVEVSNEFGHGIGVVHQDRGEGAYGPWQATANRIHHNTVVHLSRHGQNGMVMDTDEDWFWKRSHNRFDWNTYIVSDGVEEYWNVHDRGEVWAAFRRLGYERNGELVVEQREPMDLSCVR